MGNTGSTGAGGGNTPRGNSNHHHPHHAPPVPPPQQQPEASANRYVFSAATPYAPQYPNPNPPPYYQYAGYYPPPPSAMPPAPFDHHHHPSLAGGGRNPCSHVAVVPTPIEHQKAVTIRNDVNLRKETLRVEPDEQNPGHFLLAFTFDATVAGKITILFFAKEVFDCNLTSTKEGLLEPVTISFKEGLDQKFRQPSGTGIVFSMFEEEDLVKEGEMEVYPLAIKAEASPSDTPGPLGENQKMGTQNSQITQAVFEKKENEKYQVRVVKQILWVNGTRYELQEIYGIGNSVDDDFNGNDPGKECVICLSEPRDTTVLPCRHMRTHHRCSATCESVSAASCNFCMPRVEDSCMCSECAKLLRFQTNRCPICRQPVERLLEIKVRNGGGDEEHS